MKLLTTFVLFAVMASAQDTPANPLVTVSKNIYAIAKSDILGSVEEIPEDLWSYPADQRMFEPIAQFSPISPTAQYEFCGVAVEGKVSPRTLRRPQKTKAEIIPALKEHSRIATTHTPK